MGLPGERGAEARPGGEGEGQGSTAREGGVPLPPDRPAELGPSAGAPEETPQPGPAPATGGAPSAPAQAEAPPLPPERPDDIDRLHEPKPPTTTEAEQEACLARLKETGATFEPRPAINEGDCGSPKPLALSGLGNGVSISPPATVNCLLGEALVRWAKDVVQPAAEAGWKQKLTAIRIGTSYQCRGQNHVATAKLSEHAYANGVDVAGFEIGTTIVNVDTQKSGTPEEAFQKTVREGACPIFTTVLGPGTNAEHATHLHLDLRARKNGYRICQ